VSPTGSTRGDSARRSSPAPSIVTWRSRKKAPAQFTRTWEPVVLGQNVVPQFPDRCLRGKVRAEELDVLVRGGLADLLHRGVTLLGIAADEDDARALRCERVRRGLANARGSSRDQTHAPSHRVGHRTTLTLKVPVPSAPHIRGHNGGCISMAREVPGHGEAGRTGFQDHMKDSLSSSPLSFSPSVTAARLPSRWRAPIMRTSLSAARSRPQSPWQRPGHRFVPETRW
jgi:hypothetical protein